MFTLSEKFPDYLERLETVRKVSRLSGKFLDRPAKLSRQSGNLFTLNLMFRLHLIANFVYMRKNFPDVQKLSGRQCRRADVVFGTLGGSSHVPQSFDLTAPVP